MVLVAHTEAEARRAIRRALESTGEHVVEAASADAALALCRSEAPDVALVQEHLLGDDGVLLVDAIKRDVDLFTTAVVQVQRQLELEPVLEALRRGVHDVLREPVEQAEAVARVRAAARTRTLQHELGAQSRRLETLIYADELTGLFNRRFLLTQLSALHASARRHDRRLSVVMLDVDHFKRVNDEHGHAGGDTVLAAVAATLRDRLREEDWVGRLGGEEFLALLPDDDADGAAVVSENLRSAIEHMGVRHEGRLVRVTVSAGWATLEDDEGPDELLRRADDALYAAKAAGRNTALGAATLRRRI